MEENKSKLRDFNMLFLMWTQIPKILFKTWFSGNRKIRKFNQESISTDYGEGKNPIIKNV